MKKQIICTFLPILTVSIMLIGCTESEKKSTPTEVSIAVVKEKTVPFKRYLVGQTVAEDTVNLKARVTGYIQKVNFKWGSIVEKGQVLFELEQSQYIAELAKAESNLTKALAIQYNSEKDYKRQKGLYIKHAVSEDEYDNAIMTKKTADANVKDAESALKIAKLNISYTNIRAPLTGKIDKPLYSVGNLVSPESGTLATIVKLDPIQVEFNPDEVNYLNVNPTEKMRSETTARIKLSNNKIYKYKGKVVYSDNKIDSTTGTINARASFPNPDYYLLPGQYVNIFPEKKENQTYLVIPQEAVMSGQIGEYVYLVNKDDIVETRTITTGPTDDTDIAVTAGLKAGDIVITKGLQKVRNVQKVIPVKEL